MVVFQSIVHGISGVRGHPARGAAVPAPRGATGASPWTRFTGATRARASAVKSNSAGMTLVPRVLMHSYRVTHLLMDLGWSLLASVTDLWAARPARSSGYSWTESPYLTRKRWCPFIQLPTAQAHYEILKFQVNPAMV